MTTRDYAEPPEAPDLGQEVPEDTALTMVGQLDADPLDAGYAPPDRPYLSDDDEAVHREQPLDRRLDRERPDVTPDDPNAVADDELPDQSEEIGDVGLGAESDAAQAEDDATADAIAVLGRRADLTPERDSDR